MSFRSSTTDILKRQRNNFLSLSAAEVIAKGIGAVLYIILARYLGPEQFGTYSLAVSFFLIFNLLANLGLDPLIIKDVARDSSKSESYFSHAVLLKLAGGCLSFCLVFAICLILGYESEIKNTILIFALLLFFRPLNAAQQSIFKAHLRMGYVALMNVFRPALNLLLVLPILAMGLGVQAVAATHVLIGVILFLGFYYFVLKRHFCNFSLPQNSFLLMPLLKSASPFVFIGFLYIINTRVDILMISKLVGIEAVGYYSAAQRLIAMIFVIPTILSTVLFPNFSADYGRAELIRLAKSGNFAVKLLNVIGIPSGMGIFLLAPEIIQLAYGKEYLGSVIVLRILSLAICFFFSRSVLSWLLTAVERVKTLMKINLIALGLNVLLDISLIPSFGYAGAAVGTLLSMCFSYVCVCWFLTQQLKKVVAPETFIKPIFASLIMIGVLILCKELHVFLKIGIGIGIYCLATLFMSVFDKKEIALLRQIVVPEGRW